jgi:hypothetical protein
VASSQDGEGRRVQTLGYAAEIFRLLHLGVIEHNKEDQRNTFNSRTRGSICSTSAGD